MLPAFFGPQDENIPKRMISQHIVVRKYAVAGESCVKIVIFNLFRLVQCIGTPNDRSTRYLRTSHEKLLIQPTSRKPISSHFTGGAFLASYKLP